MTKKTILQKAEQEHPEKVKDAYIKLLEEELKAVQKKLEEAEKVIKFYSDEKNWFEDEGACYKDNMDSVDVDSEFIAGKRAREYLNKKSLI